jgi:prepilin-type N-terminal cleavage/methylation domain-containing protein
MPMRLNKSGFTLVELLIVIVVIAILATISVVAYNGIQQRAVRSAIASDLAGAVKKIELFNAEKGRYPTNLTEYLSIGVKFSRSPIGTNSLLCYNTSGYAIYLRDPRDTTYAARIQKGGSIEHLGSNAFGNATDMCSNTPYPTPAWGSYWLPEG